MAFRERIQVIKRLIFQKGYNLQEVFGCSEQFPPNCPTFLEREVHRRFLAELKSNNIIIVYGESRQGKTWTVDRYCPQQVRIGCTLSMDIQQIKIDMLHAAGMEVREIEHSITQGYSTGNNIHTTVGAELIAQAGGEVTTAITHSETMKTTYRTVELDNSENFLRTLEKGCSDRFFVFDNFHYLAPHVQQEFCSLLKEFNYRGIKVIIVGVWRESSKITALAPDLVNRCVHIDVGSWSKDELNYVTRLGEQALNISIERLITTRFIDCCANNIGIYKDLLQKFCQKCGITGTQKNLTYLNSTQAADEAINIMISEAYAPLHDRLKNLSTPQKKRRDSKDVRKKIVVAILRIIIQCDAQSTQTGLDANKIQNEVDKICKEQRTDAIQHSNVMQELVNLHLREENSQTGQNFIPLFYFDRTNRKLLVIEPTIYVIKACKCSLLQKIVDEL